MLVKESLPAGRSGRWLLDLQQIHEIEWRFFEWETYGTYIYILVGGLEHEFYFSIYWECPHPN